MQENTCFQSGLSNMLPYGLKQMLQYFCVLVITGVEKVSSNTTSPFIVTAFTFNCFLNKNLFYNKNEILPPLNQTQQSTLCKVIN